MDDSTLQSVFWNHLVYPELAVGEVADATVREEWIRDRLPDARWPEYVVCLAVDGLDTAEPDVRIDSVEAVRSFVEERLVPAQRALFGFAHTNAVYFCGCQDKGRAGFVRQLESLQQALKTVHGISSSIGLAFLPEATLEGFRWAAQYAVVAQRRKVRHGINRVFVWDTSQSPAPIELGEYWKLARRMQSVIRTGDSVETESALKDITKALFEDRYLNLIHLRPVLQVQVIFMAQAASEVGADADAVAQRSEDFLHQIGSAFDYSRLRELHREAALFFAGKVRERFESLSTRLISAVDEYIAEHLTDPDLGLHSIAVHLGADPAHVSRTWKRTKGTGLTRSINLQRIEQAKRLLLDRRNSISSIAFECGFGSIQHFGRVFRQVTGTSPREYRHAKNV